MLLLWSAAALSFMYMMNYVAYKPFPTQEERPRDHDMYGSHNEMVYLDNDYIVNIEKVEGGYMGIPYYKILTHSGKVILTNRLSH